MLVLTRRAAEMIYLDFSGLTDADLRVLRAGEPIAVTVVETRGDKVRLGFDAPHPVKILRKEIYEQENVAALVANAAPVDLK